MLYCDAPLPPGAPLPFAGQKRDFMEAPGNFGEQQSQGKRFHYESPPQQLDMPMPKFPNNYQPQGEAPPQQLDMPMPKFPSNYHPLLHGVGPLHHQSHGAAPQPSVPGPAGFSTSSILSVQDFLNKMQTSMPPSSDTLQRFQGDGNRPQGSANVAPLNFGMGAPLNFSTDTYHMPSENPSGNTASSSPTDMRMNHMSQQSLQSLTHHLSTMRNMLQPTSQYNSQLHQESHPWGQPQAAPSTQIVSPAPLAEMSGPKPAEHEVEEAPQKTEGAGATGSRKTSSTRNATVRWTRAEHAQFLRGLEHFGTGLWSSISQVYVPSRTPAQVASHHQKFAIRSAVPLHERQKPSVLDITTPAVQKILAKSLLDAHTNPLL